MPADRSRASQAELKAASTGSSAGAHTSSEDRKAHEEARERRSKVGGRVIVEDEPGARASESVESPDRHGDGDRADDAKGDGSHCGREEERSNSVA